MEMWTTYIVNAYLEAKTLDKVYRLSGTEFGDREGKILIVSNALYGLRYSGPICNKRFADCLRDMVVFMCKLEPHIWIWHNGDIYEYIYIYNYYLSI